MIFLCGPHCTGKTELSNTLRQENYTIIELGKIVREIYTDLKVQSDFHDWSVAVEKECGPEYIDTLILEKLSKKLAGASSEYTNKVVIVGARSLRIINRIKESEIGQDNNLIIYIDSTYQNLRVRYSIREGTEISDKSFKCLLRNDETLGLNEIKKNADFIIQNNGNLSEFLNNCVSILNKKVYLKCK